MHFSRPVRRLSRPVHAAGLGCLVLCALGWLAAAPAPSAHAKEIEGVRFASRCEVGGENFTLHNVALMRYRAIFKALVAGLYVGEGIPARQVLANVPKRLEIEYFWPLKARDIVAASEALLSKNVDAETLRQLRPRIDQMHKLYADVKAGDRYALTYIPGQGTQLTLNGAVRGTVPGADFAAAYFRIWFGPAPMDVSLKQQLLR